MALPRLGVNGEAIDDLLRPLSARSLVASALLGSHPPRLPGRLLVAFAEEFGVAPGTTRVALSRMVERGELTNDDGSYSLAGDLLRRQRRQDLGRVSAAEVTWDGAWEQAVVAESGRTAAERHHLRQGLTAARLGELREGVWMRPANLDRTVGELLADDVARHVLWFRVEGFPADDGAEVVTRLFDTHGWATRADVLIAAMARGAADLAAHFRLAAAVLRHLTHDPLLPRPLYPPGWPADGLRQAYAEFERALQVDLRAFFADVIASDQI